ncbi:MAG TPA: hypothetical protein VJZ94_02155, partial [Candidatus Paceibacterota bacterium]|nr:hypothetical protein [Candidatus Paceibacterota bacterium]
NSLRAGEDAEVPELPARLEPSEGESENETRGEPRSFAPQLAQRPQVTQGGSYAPALRFCACCGRVPAMQDRSSGAEEAEEEADDRAEESVAEVTAMRCCAPLSGAVSVCAAVGPPHAQGPQREAS